MKVNASGIRGAGNITGFAFSFLFFSTVLYGVFSFSGKAPENWGIHVFLLLTALLVAIAFLMERRIRG